MTARMYPLDLGQILEYVAGSVYDAGHGLLPERQWVLDAVPLLDCLGALVGLSKEELGRCYDHARFKVAWKRLLDEGHALHLPAVSLLTEWLADPAKDPEVFLRERLGK